MAPRKAAELRPMAKSTRRSVRIKDQAALATAGILAPNVDPGHRVSKPAPKPKSKKHDCSTCGRTLAVSSFPKNITDANCNHDVNTCKACLKAWIAASLESNTYDKISCPECPELLQNSDVAKLAAQDVYARFDELERRGIAENTPGWRWCMNPKCRAGQIHESPDHAPLLQESSTKTGKARKSKKGTNKVPSEDNICVCHSCGAKACVTCDRPYHEGETCAQYQKRLKKFDREDKASLKTIEIQCKQCPGLKCKKNIQRSSGCDHMVCTQCGTNFCWDCLTTYDVISRTGHAKGCVYSLPGRFDPHAPIPQAPFPQIPQNPPAAHLNGNANNVPWAARVGIAGGFPGL